MLGIVGGVGAAGVDVDSKEHNAFQVLESTSPFAVKALSCWKFMTAASVFPPKSPSAPVDPTLYPNCNSIFCKLVTSDPWDPLLSVADEGLQVLATDVGDAAGVVAVVGVLQ